MKNRIRILSILLALGALAAPTQPASLQAAQPANPSPDTAATDQDRVDAELALVQLRGEPLATSEKSRPAKGKKIDFNGREVRAYRAELSAQRNAFKAWLRKNAPSAKVSGEFDISLNAVGVKLNGTTLDQIRTAPMVIRAEYQGVYRPNSHGDPDLALIQAEAAWDLAGGSATAGEGVKVAIIDSGIDASHPFFDDTGYPAHEQLGDRRFTNNKVIAARVFNNKAGKNGYTPEAIESHGSHVAGTVAGNYGTPVPGIPHTVSGVAPRALLGNYNVFPGDVASARSEDILNALDAAYEDGFDVMNMSLGGGASGIQDLLTIAVDNLDQANVVVAVSAGNEGPGYLTVGSPGSAERALTAGASSVPHLVTSTMDVAGSTVAVAHGEFNAVSADTTADLAVVVSSGALALGCSPADFAGADVTGKIAVVFRGACSFSTKVRNAEAAGAAIALIINNVVGDPIAMAQDGTPGQPAIPGYMAGIADAALILANDGGAATISAGQSYVQTGNADIMAGFSSWGPTDVDFRIKPDVVAPGVNVLSSIPGNEWAFFQGTSMAAPHLAGSAAIIRQQNPDYTAAQVRSAIVNTADQGVLANFQSGAPEFNVNVVGAGRENLLAAANAVVALDPVSVNFGAVPSGSGQTRTVQVNLSDLTGAGGSYSVSVTGGGGGVAYSVAPDSVTLSPDGTATVTVTMSANHGAQVVLSQATLSISDNSGVEAAHAAVFTLVK